MRAFKQGITKSEFLRELKAHQKADAFTKGLYFVNGKGCAVGCSLESVGRLKGLKLDKSDHALYPVHLGIPEWLARLEDTLFENLSDERCKTWPVEFAQAIRSGADLDKARVPFIVMVLEHSLKSAKSTKYDEAANPGVKAAVDQCAAAVKQMIEAQKSHNASKIRAAESAAWSAESAARSAAWSAAWSARSAAESAAARSAAWSAAARSAAYEYYANRLLEILGDCK